MEGRLSMAAARSTIAPVATGAMRCYSTKQLRGRRLLSGQRGARIRRLRVDVNVNSCSPNRKLKRLPWPRGAAQGPSCLPCP
jgi:hypothetical protein